MSITLLSILHSNYTATATADTHADSVFHSTAAITDGKDNSKDSMPPLSQLLHHNPTSQSSLTSLLGGNPADADADAESPTRTPRCFSEGEGTITATHVPAKQVSFNPLVESVDAPALAEDTTSTDSEPEDLEELEQGEPEQEERPSKIPRHVSFNPKVLVIQPVFLEDHHQQQHQTPHNRNNNDKNARRFATSDCWYTDQDIDTFQKQSILTIKRFRNNWRLTKDDCLRGLESSTTKLTATKVRIRVYQDLILQKKDLSQQVLAKSPQNARRMMGLILQASTQDALELAKQDEQEAKRHYAEQGGGGGGFLEDEREKDTFKCFFFWEMPKWLLAPNPPPILDNAPILLS